MRYSLSLARDYESRGVGLLSGAAYVVGELNDVLIHQLEREDFTKKPWAAEQRLVVIRGGRGKQLIRFACVDSSETFLKFKTPPRNLAYASLQLLNAEVYDPIKFVQDNIQAPIVRIQKTKLAGKQFVGLLIGDREASYSSLLSIDGDRLLATDIEPNAKGGGGREATLVFDDVDEAEKTAVRSQFELFVREAEVSHQHSYNTNTQVIFTRKAI